MNWKILELMLPLLLKLLESFLVKEGLDPRTTTFAEAKKLAGTKAFRTFGARNA